ncbi:MAG TPA: hypothetical protein VLF89_02120 [Candidatus Saccharimonadales bacterium]|nr:hypothetical protein [Candidatus Saccharimonadales bacterium]
MNQNILPLVGAGFRESSSIVFRLREKIYDKYFWSKEDMQEAEKGLELLKKIFQKNPPGELQEYFGSAFSPENIRRFKRGFHTKSIKFQTNNQTKTWVLKIGHRISPVIDLGDPSDYSYFIEYSNDLKLLQEYCKKNKKLQEFIPQPQQCFWMGEKRKKGKILILQPFVQISPLEKTLKKLPASEKKQLQEELQEIQKLQKLLMQKHKKQFDFLGEDNLVLINHNEQYHFGLLDLGLINLTKPLPLTQLVMQIAYDMVITRIQALLAQS